MHDRPAYKHNFEDKVIFVMVTRQLMDEHSFTGKLNRIIVLHHLKSCTKL